MPNVHIHEKDMDAAMKENFVCPLFRTPSCGIDVHKNLPHVFNAESTPARNPTHNLAQASKQRTLPILNMLLPCVDSVRMSSSMAAVVMFPSTVPPNHDENNTKAWILDTENTR
jgi:hypothetical protein